MWSWECFCGSQFSHQTKPMPAGSTSVQIPSSAPSSSCVEDTEGTQGPFAPTSVDEGVTWELRGRAVEKKRATAGHGGPSTGSRAQRCPSELSPSQPRQACPSPRLYPGAPTHASTRVPTGHTHLPTSHQTPVTLRVPFPFGWLWSPALQLVGNDPLPGFAET